MATIQSQLTVRDGMSPILHRINQNLQTLTGSFIQMQQAGSNPIATQNMQAAVGGIQQIMDEMGLVTAEINGATAAQVGFNQAVAAGDVPIQEMTNQQRRFNREVANGGSVFSGLQSKIMGAAATIGAAFSFKKILDLSDAMTSTQARISLIVDDGGSVQQVQDQIMASANRSRAAYQTTADAVAKMGVMAGDVFSGTDEIIAFTEQINKHFAIVGTSASAADGAMLQLSQAMASGVLRGEELNSIFEAAPTILQSIADYMDIPSTSIRAMAQDGQITADIVKNAMLATAEETNAKFESMPMTWAQLWDVALNNILSVVQPIIQAIGQGAQWISDNWDVIAPILYGVAAAAGAVAIGLGVQAAATWIATGAAQTFFTTLLTNPLTWIALIVGVIIAAIYKWVQAVGGIDVAWKIVSHHILVAWDWVQMAFTTGVYWVLNLWDKMKLGMMTAGTGIANFMGDMKANVLMILQNMVNGAINIINGFIGVLNAIPGVNIGLIEQVTFGTTAQLENEAAKQARLADLDAYRSEVQQGILERENALQAMKDTAATNAAARLEEIYTLQGANAVDDGAGLAPVMDMSGIAADTGDIADNTGSAAASLKNMSEELSYMRDIAEREAVNRYTTAELHVDMTGMTNRFENDMDVDGVINRFVTGVTEALDVAAEGVHQ